MLTPSQISQLIPVLMRQNTDTNLLQLIKILSVRYRHHLNTEEKKKTLSDLSHSDNLRTNI